VVEYWKSPPYKHFPDLKHGLSFRGAGNMSFRLGDQEEAGRNRRRFLAGLGIDPARAVGLNANHGTEVVKISSPSARPWRFFDAAYTLDPRVVIFGTFADCLPVFLLEPRSGVHALVHAGWRGVADGVVASTVREMAKERVRPDRLSATIGPHIQGSCFEVQADVSPLFGKQGTVKVSLAEAVCRQLGEMGVSPERIRVSGDCVHCDVRFFSHRRERGEGAGLAFIGRI